MRPFGKTGIQLSELALGTASLTSAAGETIAFALERGINAIELEAGSDAELLVGDVLRGRAGREVQIVSRIRSLIRFDLPSPHIPAYQAYPGRHIREQTEESLKRLGVERLACLQIHAWCPEWLSEGDWLETLARLREEGKIAAIGVSLFDHDVDSSVAIVSERAVDAIQLMYNLFDQSAAEGMLDLCARNNVAVIARSPLYFGGLTPNIREPEPFTDWRRDYFFKEHLDETRRRADALERDVGDLRTTALRFALSHPAISTVAVGMSRPDQVAANLKSIEEGALAPELIQMLRAQRWLC